MVAPSLTFADSLSKGGHVHSSDDTSLNAAIEKRNHVAICFVTPVSINSSSEERRQVSNYCNGDTKGSSSCNHGTRVIKEPQSYVAECGIQGIKEGKEPESDKDKFRSCKNDSMHEEPTRNITSRAHDTGTAQQPTKSTEPIVYASINAGCAPKGKGKRVQWNDNNGKELVHVYEYAVSDTGESEEDEDSTDTCACTIQ